MQTSASSVLMHIHPLLQMKTYTLHKRVTASLLQRRIDTRIHRNVIVLKIFPQRSLALHGWGVVASQRCVGGS